jgi:hypothetical protein
MDLRVPDPAPFGLRHLDSRYIRFRMVGRRTFVGIPAPPRRSDFVSVLCPGLEVWSNCDPVDCRSWNSLVVPHREAPELVAAGLNGPTGAGLKSFGLSPATFITLEFD